MLLPLAPPPFTAPTDRDMLPSERRAFVYTHRTCVFGFRRLHDAPAMSVVHYVPTDPMSCSFQQWRIARKPAVARDGRVGLCVPGERWPFAFLQVYADAEIERERDLVSM